VLWRYPRWRWLGAAYAAAMLFAIVYLGEHYVVDGLAGWAVAGACWAGVNAWLRARPGGELVNETRVAKPVEAGNAVMPASRVTDG
jgi:membrane-associated phospholipid phosphatase